MRADITETDNSGRNPEQHLLQEATQEEMGIEGETKGKTKNIRKEKQSTPSPIARTKQAQELVRTVVFAKIPKEPHSDGPRTRRSGSVVHKTLRQILAKPMWRKTEEERVTQAIDTILPNTE